MDDGTEIDGDVFVKLVANTIVIISASSEFQLSKNHTVVGSLNDLPASENSVNADTGEHNTDDPAINPTTSECHY